MILLRMERYTANRKKKDIIGRTPWVRQVTPEIRDRIRCPTLHCVIGGFEYSGGCKQTTAGTWYTRTGADPLHSHPQRECRFVIFPLEQIGVDVEVAASAVLEERYGTAQICQTVPTLRQQLVGMTVARYVLHGRGQLRNARLQHHVNERG